MEILTERLTLRELTEDDWRDLLAYQSDPRYLEFYPWTERTEQDVRAFVAMLCALQHEVPRRKFQLAITLTGDGRVIGNCGIRRKDGNDVEADIGYELAPDQWGKGYATEAARAMVAHGFIDMALHRVSSWCIADNVRSVRVLEKAGLRLEGRLRENEFFKGRWWDTLLWGMLADEWRA
jgi:RimJ/RimL family protein N-acetyltransferase